MNSIIKSTAALAILVAVLVPTQAPAQTTVDVQYGWTAPTTGSPVDYYVVQHSIDGGNWVNVGNVSQLTYTLTAEYGVSHQIRVAGVDAEGRQGPFSQPSDPYTPDAGSPGQPGKPILF
jgi:hypothetical protein